MRKADEVLSQYVKINYSIAEDLQDLYQEKTFFFKVNNRNTRKKRKLINQDIITFIILYTVFQCFYY